MNDPIELATIEAAREYASQQGPCLVTSADILDQIQKAEAAGGFEGGMSGASGEGGYSTQGNEGPTASSAAESAPVELLDMHGAVPVGVFLEEAVEKIMDIKDVWEAFHGEPLGPVLLVPKKELDRWLGLPTDGA